MDGERRGGTGSAAMFKRRRVEVAVTEKRKKELSL
jgi:hypothetical protein